jgi:hypothetical protein
MREHRRAERRSASLRVELREYVDDQVVECEAADLSPYGAFLLIRKTKAFHLGQFVTLRLPVEGQTEPLVVTAEVVRLVDRGEARDEHTARGIAVEFLEQQPRIG